MAQPGNLVFRKQPLLQIKNDIDKGNKPGLLLTDPSKAFDCILHDLLIAKLHAHGFSPQLRLCTAIFLRESNVPELIHHL